MEENEIYCRRYVDCRSYVGGDCYRGKSDSRPLCAELRSHLAVTVYHTAERPEYCPHFRASHIHPKYRSNKTV